MRTMLQITIPVETGNKAIKDGTLPKTMEAFMQKYKPEAAYFFPKDGKRSALFVFDLPDPTHIPAIAESFFSNLNAEIFMTPVMNADDLRAGLAKAMQSMG
jgi:hypothetical protein